MVTLKSNELDYLCQAIHTEIKGRQEASARDNNIEMTAIDNKIIKVYYNLLKRINKQQGIDFDKWYKKTFKRSY